ncbi:MAG: GntR family transcriptional regulator [Terriglobia bacterium]
MELESYIEKSFAGRLTIADGVALALRRAILDGALEGGLVLRQEELARKFGVSRVPVREALLKLEADGLVHTHPRRGVVVTSLSAADFSEILEMREALEPLALKLAIMRITDAQLEPARAILKEVEAQKATSSEDDLFDFEVRWGDLNWTFHRALYLPAQRPRLLDTIENLHLLFSRHLRTRFDSLRHHLSPEEQQRVNGRDAANSEWRHVHDEHHEILDACTRKNISRATRLLRIHISQHGQELVARLEEKGR